MTRVLLTLLLLCFSIAAAQTVEKTELPSSPPDVLAGTWRGPWESRSRNSGEMEIEARMVDAANIQGRMKASFINPTNCSNAWETLSGVKKGDKFFARYDLGGVCGKVDVVFSIQANVMAGTWANEYGRSGTFRLVKK
jgi:hypothetical protein